MKPHIRWMVHRDLSEVLAIDAASFESNWSTDDYKSLMREKFTIGMVAESDAMSPGWSPILGLMLYRLRKRRIEVVRLAVHPDHRRQGIGRALVAKLQGKLSLAHRPCLVLDVLDSLTPAHLFLRTQGFTATEVIGPEFAGERDLYQFKYYLPEAASHPPLLADPRCDWRADVVAILEDRRRLARNRLVQISLCRLIDTIEDCAPLAVTLSLPVINTYTNGQVRITWQHAGRTVHLVATSERVAVRVWPETYIKWVSANSTPTTDLNWALEWAFVREVEREHRYLFEEEDRAC